MATIHNGEAHSKTRQHAPFCEPLQQSLHALLCELPWAGASHTGQLRTIGLTSCCRGEGVSTLAAQLALAAAGFADRRVLLVDGNLMHPSVHRTFDIDISPGLAEALAEENGDACSAAQTSCVTNLSLLPAGNSAERGTWRFDPAHLPAIVQGLKVVFDLVVFDMPAVLEEGSASRLASLLDGVLLVVEAERIRWEVARRGQQTLVNAQARLLGAVLNKRRQPIPDWLYRRL